MSFFLAPACPGTRAFSPPGHLLLLLFFLAPPAVPPLPVCSFPFPRCLLALCFTPSGGAVGFCFFFGLPPPFPQCILPCGSLLPACTHISTAQVIWSRLPSVLFSCPTALLGRGPWRSPAMPGGRPSLASFSSLPSLPSPLFCLLSALALLFSCSVCSPLVVPAPGLYLTRSHAPQGLRPVLRPVGDLGRPPKIPLQGDSPVVCPRRPPLHYFSDGWAGRPVRFNAGNRHGVSLRETKCTFVRLLAPRFPLIPRGPVPSV